MSIELPSFGIGAGELLQHVSRVAYRNTMLYYGRDGTNRYDAPARDYGVLYLGRDLPTALMESVFHKHQWDKDANRSIAWKEVQGRLVRLIGVLEQVSSQVHARRGEDGVPLFDGALYPSRNNYPGRAIALFDRAQSKVKAIADIARPDHADWPRFVESYRIGVEPPPGLADEQA